MRRRARKATNAKPPMITSFDDIIKLPERRMRALAFSYFEVGGGQRTWGFPTLQGVVEVIQCVTMEIVCPSAAEIMFRSLAQPSQSQKCCRPFLPDPAKVPRCGLFPDQLKKELPTPKVSEVRIAGWIRAFPNHESGQVAAAGHCVRSNLADKYRFRYSSRSARASMKSLRESNEEK
jgi:hypothetical protein